MMMDDQVRDIRRKGDGYMSTGEQVIFRESTQGKPKVEQSRKAGKGV